MFTATDDPVSKLSSSHSVVFVGYHAVRDTRVRQACMAMIILKYPYIVSSLSQFHSVLIELNPYFFAFVYGGIFLSQEPRFI